MGLMLLGLGYWFRVLGLGRWSMVWGLGYMVVGFIGRYLLRFHEIFNESFFLLFEYSHITFEIMNAAVGRCAQMCLCPRVAAGRGTSPRRGSSGWGFARGDPPPPRRQLGSESTRLSFCWRGVYQPRGCSWVPSGLALHLVGKFVTGGLPTPPGGREFARGGYAHCGSSWVFGPSSLGRPFLREL